MQNLIRLALLAAALALAACTTTNTQGDLTLKQPPAVRY